MIYSILIILDLLN